MIKQSISWWCFHRGGMDAEHLMQETARIGYRGVDLLGEQYWQMARDQGLTITAVSGHGTISDGLNRRENHPRVRAEIRTNLEKAVQWGIPNLVVFSGNRAGLSEEAGAEATAEILSRVATEAEAAGVTLVLELLNSRRDHPDYQADRTAWGVEVCERVGSPNVKLLYDIYHMAIMEGDVISHIQQNSRYFGHYHTAGVPGRHDLDEEQELNYTAIVRAINATGYEGWLGHEFLPKGDPIAALEAAFRTCNV